MFCDIYCFLSGVGLGEYTYQYTHIPHIIHILYIDVPYLCLPPYLSSGHSGFPGLDQGIGMDRWGVCVCVFKGF